MATIKPNSCRWFTLLVFFGWCGLFLSQAHAFTISNLTVTVMGVGGAEVPPSEPPPEGGGDTNYFTVPNAPTNVWAAAGVPGGIPTRTTVYTNLPTTVTTSQLLAAMAACPSNQVIQLTNGTYTFSNLNTSEPGPSFWTLRGNGMGNTILNISGGGLYSAEMGSYPPWVGAWSGAVTAAAGQGSTNIWVSSTNGFTKGRLGVIDMANADWVVGYGTGGGTSSTINSDSAGKGRDGNRVQLHCFRIEAVSATNITIWPPLPFDLDSGRTPQAHYASAGLGPQLSGFEEMTVNFSNSDGVGGFMLGGWFGGWMKNVEVKNWNTFGLHVRWSPCFEMRGCYIHTPGEFDWSKGYGVQLDPTSGALIEDNILYNCQEEFLLQGGCSGNVIGYNFIAYSYNGYIGTNWLLQEMAVNHTPFPSYNLLEGNYTGKMQADYYYGPSGWNTIYRNRVTGNGPLITQNRIAVSLDAQQRYWGVVGNQLGERVAPWSVTLVKPGATWNYGSTNVAWQYNPVSTNFSLSSPFIYRLGYPYSGNNGSSSGLAVHDTFVKTNTLLHGNWDAMNNSVVWSNGLNTNFVASLYRQAKPSFFGSFQTWPPYGPSAPTGTTNDIAKIPAGYRLLYNVTP